MQAVAAKIIGLKVDQFHAGIYQIKFKVLIETK